MPKFSTRKSFGSGVFNTLLCLAGMSKWEKGTNREGKENIASTSMHVL